MIGVGLAVQHTGTHFLAQTLMQLTGYGMVGGWPPVDVKSPEGFCVRHLYGHPLDGYRHRESLAAFWDMWVAGTDLPVVVTVRDPRASCSTYLAREREQGAGYTLGEHVASLWRLAGILAGDELAGRVVALRVDCEAGEREGQLVALVRHLGRPVFKSVVLDWARRWPVVNSHRPRGAASVDVPPELVRALGYRA